MQAKWKNDYISDESNLKIQTETCDGLTLSLLPESSDCASHCHSTSSAIGICPARFDLATILAAPYSYGLSLHCILPTKLAEVLAMLADLHLFNLFTETSTIAGTLFSDNTGLLRPLSLHKK
nr:hypothetical protein Iba_chr13fCG6690 [Ipomoea batatas]